jgi:hypothetical protein
MSKGYKKEYIKKVKEKFNDIQPNRCRDTNNVAKPSHDKRGEICNTNRMVGMGR